MAWTDDLAKFLRLDSGEQPYVGYPQMQVGLTKPRQTGYATGFLENATGLPPMQSQGVLTNPNYESYAQGQNAGELANIGAMAIPGYAMALKAGAPKAYNALENYMVKSGGMIPLEAYHGTPHKIEGKFDINKVGTGEGAQAYGHGMYFAENPAVAKGYSDKLGYDYEYAGKAPKENSPTDLALRWLKNLDWDKEAAKSQWKNEGLGAKVIQAIDNLDLQKVKAPGNLYKVDIPDEYIPTMLNWDKSLGEQSPFVKKAINSLKKQVTPQMMDELGGDLNVLFGKNVTPSQFLNTWEIIHPESKTGIGEELLNKAGVKGVKYLDNFSRDLVGGKAMVLKTKDGWVADVSNEVQQGSGGFPMQVQNRSPAFKTKEEAQAWADKNTTKGTHNFVVFDPSTVKILEENSKPVSRKALIEEQVKKLKD